MKSISKMSRFVVIVSGLGVLVGGCSSSQNMATQMNRLAVRRSHTDQASRILAEHTLSQLAQQDEDYRLGPEDVIEVNIFEWELSGTTKTVPVRISQTGMISLPMVGELQASGKTVWELKKEIEDRLREGGYIRRPQVSIIVSEFHSKKIAVIGAVKKPGIYTIERNVTTLLDILSLAGGLSDHAGQLLYVIRRESRTVGEGRVEQGTKPTTITIDLHELMEKCDLSLNLVLRRGDIVSVPRAERFFVYGYVNKQGGFDLKTPTTVLEGIAMAEGVNQDLGSANYCVLKRQGDNGKEDFIPINLDAIRQGKKPNIYLQPNDIIDVRQTTAKKLQVGIGKLFGGIGVGLGYTLNN